jgi:hypothetical protein
VVKHEAIAIRSAGLRLLGDAEGESRGPLQAAARDMPTNGTIDPQRRGSQASPPAPAQPAATSFRPAKCPSCSGSRARRSTTSRAAASSQHAALGAVGCSSATASPPLSRRSTSPAPGVPATIPSGATTAIRGSGSPERYSKALLRRAGRAATKRSEAPKPQPLQALQSAGATGLEPAASGVTGRRSNQTELRPLGGA